MAPRLLPGRDSDAPVWASDANTKSAVPGTLNYVEGQASIGDQSLNSKSIGNAELEQGQSLVTKKGKAEVLLTPASSCESATTVL